MNYGGGGHVAAMAIRIAPRGPMRLAEAAEAVVDGGLEGHGRVSKSRGVTLLSQEQWCDVQRELGVELPWHTRRANLLIAGARLSELIGQTVQLGETVLEVIGETDPCHRMDELHAGLRQALTPSLRGGVHARVRRGGKIAVGDVLRVMAAERT